MYFILCQPNQSLKDGELLYWNIWSGRSDAYCMHQIHDALIYSGIRAPVKLYSLGELTKEEAENFVRIKSKC